VVVELKSRSSTLKPILVTGGAGFIGCNFIYHWLDSERSPLVNIDKLTYAGNLASLSAINQPERHIFVRGDVCDKPLIADVLRSHRPWAIIHFAAETHVDRSVHDGRDFIRSNVEGTFCLLQAACEYWNELPPEEKSALRFVHISTDEVYGSLQPHEPAFTETTPYAPNSPYSASKAASDHLVRAFHHTYGFPTLTTNCSNNYGPYQFPEKLIPLMIHNAIRGKRLPIYGDGKNVRDWLYVADHCKAICRVLYKGIAGETYNIGGGSERTNLEVVREICAILSELRPGSDYESLIEYVKDRPGHDRRYAVNTAKVSRETGWTPEESFHTGLRKTIHWYLENAVWVESVTSGSYRDWIELQYRAGR
jgi:dTDP-glucose 4,6-dehydratase